MKLLALIKKEFHRFFHDPRLIITVILPGVVIFALYSLLGTILSERETERKYCLAIERESAFSQLILETVQKSGSQIEIQTLPEGEGVLWVEEGKANLFLKLPEDFDLVFTGGAVGGVEVWYNATDENSVALYQIVSSLLQSVGMRFSILPHSVTNEADVGKFVLADLLPFLVVTLVFSACMSVTLESIAGEKERGTLATILATSVPRSQIALGKILPLSGIAAIGAASSFFGVVLSLPKLVGADLSVLGGYGFLSYFLLFLLILSFVPLIVGGIAAVSTFSKSVKEASAYTGVVMIFVMVLSLTSSFLELGGWALAVPVLNAVYTMGLILGGAVPVGQTFVCLGVNLLTTALLVALVSGMLSSERIMFGK